MHFLKEGLSKSTNVENFEFIVCQSSLNSGAIMSLFFIVVLEMSFTDSDPKF